MQPIATLFFLSFFLLAACTAAPATTVPTLTANPQRDLPIVTHTPTSEPQQTETPASTPSAPLEAVLAGNLPVSSVDSVSSTSPDGKWTAEAILVSFLGEAGYYDYVLLTVRDYTDTFRWTPYEEWSEGGLGDSFLSDFYWSSDGRYLYFHDTGYGHPCGGIFVTKLRRVDLTDGSLSEISLTDLHFGDITISPDRNLLVYRVEGGFFLRNLVTDETRVIPFEWAEELHQVGWYAWSPNGNQLAFTVGQYSCDAGPQITKSGTSIRILDLNSAEVQILTDYDRRGLIVKGWDDPKALKVFSNGDEMLLQIDSGTLVADPAPIASAVLEEYLNSLAFGRVGMGPYTYERAADLYGGSYQTLIEMNSEIEPNDHEALLSKACETNGFQCLRLHDVVSARTLLGSDGSYDIHMTVQLAHSYGGIFFTGLCCGSGGAPPQQTKFDFTVRQLADGRFQVLDLPPYAPQ